MVEVSPHSINNFIVNLHFAKLEEKTTEKS
jgi:hypothetical protein